MTSMLPPAAPRWQVCRDVTGRNAVVRALHHAVSYLTILRRTQERSRRERAGTLPFLLREAVWYLRNPIGTG